MRMGGNRRLPVMEQMRHWLPVDEEDSYQKWGFPRSLLKFNLMALAPVSDTGDAGGVVSALRQTQGRNGVKRF